MISNEEARKLRAENAKEVLTRKPDGQLLTLEDLATMMTSHLLATKALAESITDLTGVVNGILDRVIKMEQANANKA